MSASVLRAALRCVVAALLVCAVANSAIAQEDGPAYTGTGVSIGFQTASLPLASTGQGVSIAFQNGDATGTTGSGASIAFQTASLPLASTGQGVSIAFQTASLPLASTGQGVSIAFQTASLPISSTGQGVSIAFQNTGDFSSGSGVTIGFGVPDTTAPETSIITGPAEGTTTYDPNATFTWSGTDDRAGAITFSYRLDAGAFSQFDTTTSLALTGLSLGSHTFEVMARDASGNIDLTPAIRQFVVAQPSFFFTTSTGGTTFSQGVPVPVGAFVYDTSNLSVPLGPSAVTVQAAVLDSAGATLVGPTTLSFNTVTTQFTGELATSSLPLGAYQANFAFFTPGGTPVGSPSAAFVVTNDLSVSVATDRAEYGRGQAVALNGRVQDSGGAPVSGVAVGLAITARGATRSFTVFTNTQGDYTFLFVPPLTEAGNYTVAARALSGSIAGNASASFIVHGLVLEPTITAASLSMNSTLPVPLRVRNIGETALSDIALAVQDFDLPDGIVGALDVTGISTLPPGASRDLTLTLSAPSGVPPTQAALFKVAASASQGVSELASISASLREAQGIPIVEPASVNLGMNPGTSRLLPFTLRNEGFAPILNGQVQVVNPGVFNWVTIEGGALGTVEPGQAKTFSAVLAPPAALPLGIYVIQIEAVSSFGPVVVPLTVEITSSEVRPVALQISDDAARDVAGATVTLVSKAQYTRVTPSGTEQYNQTYQGTSDPSGQLGFTDVAAGAYTLLVRAAGHADYDAEVTIDAGTSPLTIEVILTTTVVDFSFRVTRTSITDEYDVSLVVTYSTDLVKPALIGSPSRLDLSFFPEQPFSGQIRITNSHTQVAVTNVLVDASQLDAGARQLSLIFNESNASTLTIPSLAPGETRTIPFAASLPPGALPPSHTLGSIVITGGYVYSLRGEARQGTTESEILVSYGKPTSLRMFPPIEFLNDETGGTPAALQYLGTTTRIVLENERTVPLDLLDFNGDPNLAPPVRAIQLALPANIPADQVPLALMGVPSPPSLPWTGQLDANRLEMQGGQAAFDIGQLLVAVNDPAHHDAVVAAPPYIGVVGQWADGATPQGFVFPISVTTIRPGVVQVVQPGPPCQGCGSGGGGGGAIPQSFNNHGQIKVQIDQRVSVEREAFNASLDILPAVSLENFSAALSILDQAGNDAGNLFVVTSTETPSSPIQGPARAGWLIIPKVAAGGTTAAGLNYTVTAQLGYSAGGVAVMFETAPESFNVQPLPRLRLDYTIPYVVMGTIPFSLQVNVTNVGAGPANTVTLDSAQPRIVENANNVPVGFGVDGASTTGQDVDVQAGVTKIAFGTIAPGAMRTGSWRMHATRRGFVVDFDSTLTQRTVNGAVLDPIIEQVNLHFATAVGGALTRSSGCVIAPLSVQVRGLPGIPVLTDGGSYYAPSIAPRSRLGNPPGSYFLDVIEEGRVLGSSEIDVLADQPTDFIDFAVNNATVDTDGDGMRDCFEIANGSNRLDPTDGSSVSRPVAADFGKPPNQAMNADPVNTATGNYIFEHTDLAVPGRGQGVAFSRFYNSLDSAPGPLGPGWTHSYNAMLTVVSAGQSADCPVVNGDQAVQVRWGDGRADCYDRWGAVYLARFPGVYDTLTQGADGTFSVLKKTQTQWHFTTGGRLGAITDRNGNSVALGYDGAGRLVTVQEPAGRTLSLTYDGAGRVAAVTDPLPRSVAFAYDGTGHLASVTDVDGGVEAYTYDANGQLLTATDPRGAVFLTNTYDATRRVVTWQADAKGNRFQFAYDEATRETTITDPLGQASVDAYDERKRLVRQTDRLGRSVIYGYDGQNNRTSLTDKNGYTTTYAYDGIGNVVSKVNPLNQTTAITYDALNNPLTRTDEAGGVTSFTYDGVGNLLSTTDPLNQVTAFSYDVYGQLLTSTNVNGGVTTQAYDAASNLMSVTDPTGAVTAFAYDAIGRKGSVTDPLGHTTQFTYDGAGRLLTATDALNQVVAHAYDPNGNRTQTTDTRGGVTTFTYDANNLITTVGDALGGVTQHSYDALDRRVTTTDARGMVTAFAYDAEGRLTETTDPTGGITRIAYDGVGNKAGVTDANGRTSAFAYDALNRLVTTTDALGHVTRSTYDQLGRVATTADAAGRVTTMAYDAVSRLTQVTDPAGGTARYTYDAIGNRLTVTDPNGQATTLTYDRANRLLTSTDSLGQRYQYTYDGAGNRTTQTDAKGAALDYSYDAANRLITVQPPAGSTVAFGYDAAGNRTTLSDAVGATAYTYDAFGRVTRYVDAYGQAIGYEYDAVGNRTALVYPDGKRVSYVFDGAQRLTRVTDWGGRVTQYLYDAAGRLTGTVNANGTTVAAAYDAAAQLTNLASQRADGSVLASYAYTLDAVGNRTAAVQNEPLLGTAPPAVVPYTYSAANQIQSAGTTNFASDPNGNLTSRVSATGTTAYAWDIFDRLTQVSDGTTTAQYVYNGVGTRLARTINGVTTRFVVDPQPTLSQLLVETDGSGTPTARYVYGLGLIARVDAAGTALTYHFDPRGSTVAMTDGTQAIVNRYAYDEFGAVLNKQETAAQPFDYVGQFGVMQEPNGLLFMRARYYAPAEGRFLNVDPSPTIDTLQDLNLLAYANGNPVTRIDPAGLTWWDSEIIDAVVTKTRNKLVKDATKSWLAGVVNSHGFDVLGDVGFRAWQAVPLISVAQSLGRTLGEHWDDPHMDWTEKGARASLAVANSAAVEAASYAAKLRFGSGASLGVSVAGGITSESSLDWQMGLLKKWIGDPLGGGLYDLAPSLFAGGQTVIMREQIEVQRPVSSTKQKIKRDAPR